MSNTIFKLGIVGLGNIGFGYDRNSPPSFARTHASAAELHPAVELLWGVDTSVEAREEFQNKYAANSFSRLEDAFSSGAVDIVALAVAVEDRDELWSALLKAKPEVVICEKPLAASAAACAEIADKCSAAGIDLVVNYPRRFISQAARAKHLISSAEIGDLQAGHVVNRHDLAVLRPAPPDSIKPYDLDTVLGMGLVRDVAKGTALQWGFLEAIGGH